MLAAIKFSHYLFKYFLFYVYFWKIFSLVHNFRLWVLFLNIFTMPFSCLLAFLISFEEISYQSVTSLEKICLTFWVLLNFFSCPPFFFFLVVFHWCVQGWFSLCLICLRYIVLWISGLIYFVSFGKHFYLFFCMLHLLGHLFFFFFIIWSYSWPN